MESFAPALGMSMMIFGLVLLLFSAGGLAYTFWRRSEAALEKARQQAIEQARQEAIKEILQTQAVIADNPQGMTGREG